MNLLTIKAPVITQHDGRSKLSAKIVTNTNTFDLWYDVDSNYEKYLCCENSDAFLVAVLPLAMEQKLDITCEGAISEKLFYNLQYNLIPIIAKYSNIFSKINIQPSSLTSKCFNAQTNATGISCGVDSFDTIKDTHTFKSNKYKISALTFFNVGSHRSTVGYTAEQSYDLFKKRFDSSKKVANYLKMPIIDINSNLGSHLNQPFVKVHHFCSFSAVLALQKYFSNYFYSSGYPVDCFSIKKCDKGSAFYELLLAQYLSTETTEFHITGLDKSRIEKIKNISDFPVACDNLNVCFKSDKNCGHCEKCIRTQLEIYSCGKLEKFRNSFDIEDFNKNKDKYIMYMLKHQNQVAYKDILSDMKRNNISLSPMQKFMRFIFAVYIKIFK